MFNDKTLQKEKGILGTPKYAAPELTSQSLVTNKVDVYSFGIM
jgi:serine/threonine protein kinase